MILPGNALPKSRCAEGAASRRIDECHHGATRTAYLFISTAHMWTAWSKAPAQCSKPNSCCRGRSRRRQRRRSTWPSSSINMWVTNATAAVLSIITGGGKWVEIDARQFALSAPPFDGGKEILALRRERRAPASAVGPPARCRRGEPPYGAPGRTARRIRRSNSAAEAPAAA